MVVISAHYSNESTVPKDKLLEDVIVLVNPQIESLTDRRFKWEEACLSVPNYSDIVERNADICLKYTDLSGRDHEIELSEPFSGIVQHEVDHLQGILYLDRLPSSRRKKAHNTLLTRARKKREAAKKAAKKARTEKEKPEIRNGFRPAGAKTSSKRKKRPKKSYGKNKKKR